MGIYSDWNDTMLHVVSAKILDSSAAEGTFNFRVECLLFLFITLWSPPDAVSTRFPKSRT